MRAAGPNNTIHQTLTPAAAAVLNESISAAARRRHAQTTPLHVAAALLSSPSNFLRRACLRSHPNSSHPLQPRALELCFNVALDRLPSSPPNSDHPPPPPPLSNALTAALKRAAAHQRRGCPDHQPPPLLAVRVELDRLVVAILDDPGVSRVMREAGFRSPAVKASIEETPSPNAYMNPKLRNSVGERDEILLKGVFDVLLRSPSSKKKNPILVGDSDVSSLMREVVERIKSGGAPPPLATAGVISFKADGNSGGVAEKIRELGESIVNQRVVIDLGDLKWLVEGSGSAAVAEMGMIVRRFSGGDRRVWLVGSAASATYLRCQVYYPTMENDWDVQVVPVAAKLPLNSLFSSSIAGMRWPLCPLCIEGYEQEVAKQLEQRSSPALPHWLQNAKLGNPRSSVDQLQSKEQEQEQNRKQSMEELLKKWRNTCSKLHTNSPGFVMSAGLLNPTKFPCQLLRNPLESLEKTELVLATTNKILGIVDLNSFKKLCSGLSERVRWQPEAASAVANIVMQCKSGNGKQRNRMPKADTWLLFMGPDRVGKRRMASALSELVFGGAANPIIINFGGGPNTNYNDGESDARFRGRTLIDQMADAIQGRPFSVVLIEDFDQADGIAAGIIKRAMEYGRLADSSGREVSLGNVIFVLTVDWLPEEFKASVDPSVLRLEKRVLESANCGWGLELSVTERMGKHRAELQLDSSNNRPTKLRKESHLFDLNLAAEVDNDCGEGSRDSSDLTVEHDDEHEQSKEQLAIRHPITAACNGNELIRSVDGVVLYKPVDFGPLRKRVSDSISAKFGMIMGNGHSIKIDDDALDRILGGVWLARDGEVLDEWLERVLGPSMLQLKGNLLADVGPVMVRLSATKRMELNRNGGGDWLPATVTVAVDGL